MFRNEADGPVSMQRGLPRSHETRIHRASAVASKNPLASDIWPGREVDRNLPEVQDRSFEANDAFHWGVEF